VVQIVTETLQHPETNVNIGTILAN